MRLLSTPLLNSPSFQLTATANGNSLLRDRVPTNAVSPRLNQRQYTVLQDSSVTTHDTNALSILSYASIQLVDQRNRIVDSPELLNDSRAGQLLSLIDNKLDDIELQLYGPIDPTLRFEKTLRVLKQSEKELDHCRRLLGKNRGDKKETT